MTKEPERIVILQGGRLCGLPGVKVPTRLNVTEFSDDDDGRVYMYEKHHLDADGIEVFRIVGVRPPLPKNVTQQEPTKAKKPKKKIVKKNATPPRPKKD
jgi:hypothetical protein